MNTCAEIDDDIEEKEGVGHDVEDDPARGVDLFAEEGDGHGENDDVGDQQDQHQQVPVEAKVRTRMDDAVAGALLSHSLLEKAFLAAEELHGQLVVTGFEQIHEVVDDGRRAAQRRVEADSLFVQERDLIGRVDLIVVHRVDLLEVFVEEAMLRLDRHRDRRVGRQGELALHIARRLRGAPTTAVRARRQRQFDLRRRLLIGQLRRAVLFDDLDRLFALRRRYNDGASDNISSFN